VTDIRRTTIRLRDGRSLSYVELGEPSGVPVLFTMGSPSSGIGGRSYSPSAQRQGIRLISIDKPGYGQSTRQRGRSLLSFGADVRDLADALDLDRVAIAGQSGGGPHAAAAAHVLGDRVSTLSLICTYGPVNEPWAADGHNPFMRATTVLANRAPWLMRLPIGGVKLTLGTPDRAMKFMERSVATMTAKEREDLVRPETRWALEGISEAFDHGLGAVCDEFRALGRPWGFRLEDVAAPTDLWHGDSDKSCPIGMVRGMAQRMPNATMHELAGVGHGFFGEELDDAMATLSARARAAL
jgi:pimeloyl-ACP methyl ester carboxylesterase